MTWEPTDPTMDEDEAMAERTFALRKLNPDPATIMASMLKPTKRPSAKRATDGASPSEASISANGTQV
jgi:hypothetical protein